MPKVQKLPEERKPLVQRLRRGLQERGDKYFVEPKKSFVRGAKDLTTNELVLFGTLITAAIGGFAAIAPEAGAVVAVLCGGVSVVSLVRRGNGLRAPEGVTDAEFTDLGFPKEKVSQLRKRHFSRFGTEASTHSEPEEIDNTHRYLLLHRTDLLDYPSGDFFSIRRIRLKNIGAVPSDSVTYVENSERKCSFVATEVEAFATETKQPLLVESFERKTKKLFRHSFQIYFPTPLLPGEEFDLVYKIKLPGELAELSDEDEVMSVFLGRASKGVEQLTFELCLNFSPRAVFVKCRDASETEAENDGSSPSITTFAPTEWYEKKWNIHWSSGSVCKIVLDVQRPKNELYIIHYKK